MENLAVHTNKVTEFGHFVCRYRYHWFKLSCCCLILLINIAAANAEDEKTVTGSEAPVQHALKRYLDPLVQVGQPGS